MEKKIEHMGNTKEIPEERKSNPEKGNNVNQEESMREKLRGFKEYESSAYQYEKDKDGRIRRASGNLRLEKEQDRNNADQRLAGGKDRRIDDQGGHYIGRRFGGSPDLDNLFAQNGHFNQGEYKKLENKWEKYLKQTDKEDKPLYNVDVDVRSSYPKGSERPDRIFVYYKVTDANGKVVDKNIAMFKNEYESQRKNRFEEESSGK